MAATAPDPLAPQQPGRDTNSAAKRQRDLAQRSQEAEPASALAVGDISDA